MKSKKQQGLDETVVIETGKKSGSKKPWYREWSEALIFAAVLAMIIRTFIIQPFKIPSGSMLDTLLIGDHLMVNKFIYGSKIPFTDNRILPIRTPQRGDVIVFEFPGDHNESFFSRRDFIKRIIGVPGDVVEVRDKRVYVNGEKVERPSDQYKSAYTISGCSSIGDWDQEALGSVRDCMHPVTVPEKSYFVMGDNRDFSRDSRYWGFVPEASIKGLAFIKYWSWDNDNRSIRWRRILAPIE